MEHDWKLGSWMNQHDCILDPVTFEQIITAVYHNRDGRTPETVKAVAREILRDRTENFWFMVNNNIQEIIDAATPEEDRPLRNHPNWNSERLESLAQDIYKWLLSHEMWIDVSLYYDGKRMSTSTEVDGKFQSRYNGEPFIEDGYDPRDVTEYVAEHHILTAVFEGPLYHVLNAYTPGWTKLEAELSSILAKHGCYYEMGEAFNLTCYEG